MSCFSNVTRRLWVVWAVFSVLILVSVLPLRSENESKQSQLTIPWDEFKRVLKIDENDVVLSVETYQKLVAQTGVKIAASEYGGSVILKQAQFKEIITKMQAPQNANIPFDYLVTKAVYKGGVSKSNISFQCVFTVQVLKDKEYIKIPLLSSSFALEDFNVDGAAALVVTENGYHNLAISAKGKYTVTASFSMKSSLGRGSHSFVIPVQQTPITLLTLSVPLANIDVEIPQAQKLSVSGSGGGSVITAAILPTNSITVSWAREIPESEKLPSKLYTEVNNVISINDDALQVTSDISCNVLHSELNELRAVLPKDVSILNVTGAQIGEWREAEQKGERILIIPLVVGKKGGFSVQVVTEKPFTEKSNVVSFSGFKMLNAVRDSGFIGIELNTSAEVVIPEITGLEKIPVEKLPRSIYDNSDKPLMYGFKYLKHPYSLDIDVKKHEKIAVPIAVIDTANMVTLLTFDGKIVHRLIYNVRNSGKQFMELSLPKEASVWGVYVDNAPIESSMGAEGKLLVPLKRSRSENNVLSTFSVEVVYAETRPNLGPGGAAGVKLPSADLMASQLMWSLYLPNEYRYLYFGTSLEKEILASNINISGREGRKLDLSKAVSGTVDEIQPSVYTDDGAYVGDDKKEARIKRSFKNDYDPPMQRSQEIAEVGWGKVTDRQVGLPNIGVQSGALPVHIKIPTQGQIYRFAKTIVNTTDPLAVNVYYVNSGFVKLIKTLLLIAAFWFIWKKREIIKMYVNKYVPPAVNKIKNLLRVIAESIPSKSQADNGEYKVGQSRSLGLIISIVAVFIVFLFNLFITHNIVLALLSFVLIFILSTIQAVIYFRNRKKQKSDE